MIVQQNSLKLFVKWESERVWVREWMIVRECEIENENVLWILRLHFLQFRKEYAALRKKFQSGGSYSTSIKRLVRKSFLESKHINHKLASIQTPITNKAVPLILQSKKMNEQAKALKSEWQYQEEVKSQSHWWVSSVHALSKIH